MDASNVVRDHVMLTHAKRILQDAGYVVISRERRVILEANTMLPPHQEQLRIGKERLIDQVTRENERRIVRKLFDDGFVVNTIRSLNDPVTGPEEVFTSLVAVINPKP